MKIRYGISNAHYAVATPGTGGTLTYATPVAMPGAVAISLEAQGESITEYADNIEWFIAELNGGYQGTLEFESIPDSFRTAVLGEETDSKDVLWENSQASMKEFALLFQFELGDDTAVGKRTVLLRCKAGRPAINGNTRSNTINPDHETLTIRAVPRISDHLVKGSCESTSEAYASWFSAVPNKNTQ